MILPHDLCGVVTEVRAPSADVVADRARGPAQYQPVDFEWLHAPHGEPYRLSM